MGTPVMWLEINTAEAKAVLNSYAELFEWEFQAMPGVDHAGVDPQAYLNRAERAGGHTVVPVTAIPDTVTFAQLADPQATVVNLAQRDS